MESLDNYVDVKAESSYVKPVHGVFIIPQCEVVDYFSSIRSKNDVLDGFVEFGERCFANIAVFSVYLKTIQFLKGEGKNIKGSHLLGGYGIDKNTVFRRVATNKFPYRGSVPVGSDEREIFGAYFNSFSEEVFIYPGSIRGGETDILFYADTFQSSRESCLITFEYVVEKTIQALRFLWVRKQLASL